MNIWILINKTTTNSNAGFQTWEASNVPMVINSKPTKIRGRPNFGFGFGFGAECG